MRNTLIITLLPLALAACHQYPPRDCQMGSDVLVQVRSPLNDSSNRSIPLTVGESITGAFSPVGALRVDAVAVQVGTAGGTAEGEIEFRLCQDGRCVEGRSPLHGAKDNDYLEIPLQPNIGITFEGGVVSYELKRISGTKELTAWAYPGAGHQTRLKTGSGETAEVLNLMLRQH